MVGRRCYEALLGERECGSPVCTDDCPVMRLARVGRPVSSYDMRVAALSGEKRWVNVSILSLDSAEGPYLVHLLRDAQEKHETLEMAQQLIRLSHKGDDADSADDVGGGDETPETPSLTARQLEVLGLLARGRSAKEIGGNLYLSEATVRNHIHSLLQALGAHSQLEALAKARERGLLQS
jgi:DNA-binding CsgD family transcriptional regulator